MSSSKDTETGNNPSGKGSINVLASPDLYDLTSRWAVEYCKIDPAFKINVIKSPDNNVAGMLNADAGIGVISAQSYKKLNKQPAWNAIVGRDVIVPVMNAKNPFKDEFYRTGITSEGLSRLFANPGNQIWGMLLGNGQNIPLHLYIMDDSSVTREMAGFLNNHHLKITGIKVANRNDLIAAIQKDPYSLGLCKLIHAVDLNNQCLADNIKLLPIDKNGNGKIDYMENIYDNLQTFTRGVWIGKYPKALSGNIYMVSSVKPVNESELAFLRWVLTDGQQFLNPNGYSDLVFSERQTQLANLNNKAIYTNAPQSDTYAVLKGILLTIFAFVLIGLIIHWVSRPFRMKNKGVRPSTTLSSTTFDEESVIVPKGLYFDKTHTWAFMEKDGSVKIGIDDFLNHVTGPFSRIGMKPAGVKIKKGGPLLTIIQKGKQLTIYSPVSGIITAYNDSLISNSSKLITNPYSDGWVYMIAPTNWLREIQFLIMSEKYRTWLREEFLRLKDFLAAALNASTPQYAHVVLQDGGALKDGILADLGPEVWEDFQTKFIDAAK